jgi:serine/threonine protein kinase
MTQLLLDSVNAPIEIRESLKALSDIIFDTQSAKGANGYLFFGQHRILNRRVAVKYYYWGGDRGEHAEPRQLAEIDSPHVIRVEHAAVLDTNWAFFVTPFCKNGDLDELIARGPCGITEAVQLTCHVLDGLTHLHSCRLVHRDLKPANLLLNDRREAQIGDFGSVRRLPEGSGSVPGSGHSLLYRPPESLASGRYGIEGDLYQIGLLLYQLLGGYLPYEEIAWLDERQRRRYSTIVDDFERSKYVDDIVKEKIVKGAIMLLDALPPWVDSHLSKAIRKAVALDPARRFSSASEFLNKLRSVGLKVPDWSIVDGCPTLRRRRNYRIIPAGQQSRFIAQKKSALGWRRVNNVPVGGLADVVQEVNRLP